MAPPVQTVCQRGHPKGKGKCRECVRIRSRARYAWVREASDSTVEGEVTFHNAQGADGPRLVRWLVEASGFADSLTESEKRRVYDWRRGAVAGFYVVDKMLTRRGIHPSELPEDLWLGSARRPKCCEECGGKIPFVSPSGMKKSPKDYRKARFCGQGCSNTFRNRGRKAWT